jgi:hypothetical protein
MTNNIKSKETVRYRPLDSGGRASVSSQMELLDSRGSRKYTVIIRQCAEDKPCAFLLGYGKNGATIGDLIEIKNQLIENEDIGIQTMYSDESFAKIEDSLKKELQEDKQWVLKEISRKITRKMINEATKDVDLPRKSKENLRAKLFSSMSRTSSANSVTDVHGVVSKCLKVKGISRTTSDKVHKALNTYTI